jgi:hypothetical protein
VGGVIEARLLTEIDLGGHFDSMDFLLKVEGAHILSQHGSNVSRFFLPVIPFLFAICTSTDCVNNV